MIEYKKNIYDIRIEEETMNPMIAMMPTARLSMSKDYVRPAKTQTDRMQKGDDIQEFLKDYEEIKKEDVDYIPIGTLLRYIGYDKKKRREMFRYGGLLRKTDKNYMVLMGKNALTFSVQRITFDDQGNELHTTRFFKKKSPERVVENEMSQVMDRTEQVMKRHEDILKKQKEELRALHMEISRLQGEKEILAEEVEKKDKKIRKMMKDKKN